MPIKKSRKLLPKLGNDLHLSNFGYSLAGSKRQRQQSLKKASKKAGTLKVLKRTNLIRNYSKSNKDNYDKLSQDVEYLKTAYLKEKKEKKEKNKN